MRSKLTVACIAFALLAPSKVIAQEWPTRTIRIVTATPAGGSPDYIARLLAEHLSQRLGRSVIVENSARTIVATWDGVARSEPDGYTLTILSGGFTARAAVAKSLPFDSKKDFAMISLISSYPMVVSVRPNSPIKSFADLLKRAKDAPGKVTFAMNLPGSLHHLLGELINATAGTEMTGVPYRASTQALTDVLGGRVEAMIDTGTFTFPQIKSGQLRALAVSSGTRFALEPDIPTISETLPSIDVSSLLGLAAAAATPRSIIERLNKETHEILNLPEIKEKFATVGNAPTPSTPEEMQKRILTDMATWEHLVATKNIQRY